jgi:hypothetical protein
MSNRVVLPRLAAEALARLAVLPRLALLGAVAVPSAGCQEFMIKMTVDSTAPALKRASLSMDAESDVQLAREALPGNIKTIDGFLAASPENADLLELTAMAYAQYAFAFLEDDLESLPPEAEARRAELVARCTDLYDRAYALGLRHVALETREVAATAKGDLSKFLAALAKTERESAPGLYWGGMALAAAINLHRDDLDRIADLPRAQAMLERAHALDPAYYVNGAALALATIFASQGKAVGGDPDKAKRLFEEVERATGGKYLMSRVLFARYYATVTLDRALYEKTLAAVLATPASVWPEQRLANELARRRARRYLAEAESLF